MDIGSPLGDYDQPARATVGFNAITDGLSNTLLLSEVVVGQGQDLRGFSWWGDAATFEAFSTPNSSFPDVLFSPLYCINQSPNPPCTSATTALPEMYAARSRHPGGVNVALADGSVRFIKNSINFQTLAGDEHGRGSRILRRTLGPEITYDDRLAAIDRISPTREPDRWPVMRQSWRELLFLHWPIRPDQLRPLVPPQLDLDLFEGTAYVGLVPFTMTGVRPVGLPPVRGISNFHETNVRTYVHRDGRDPGVWFFSLDAANRLAVYLARTFFHLPYYHARMFLDREPAARPNDPRPILYAGVRGRPDPLPASYLIRATPTGPVQPAPARYARTLPRRAVSPLLSRERPALPGPGPPSPLPFTIRNSPVSRRDPPGRRRNLPARRPPLAHFARGVDVKVYALEKSG